MNRRASINRRALWWAVGCAALGVVMLVLGVRDALAFRAPKTDGQQILTLGQVVDIITAVALLAVATLIVVGQLRARRRDTKHRRWVREHEL